jgi:hypothetical protein
VQLLVAQRVPFSDDWHTLFYPPTDASRWDDATACTPMSAVPLCSIPDGGEWLAATQYFTLEDRDPPSENELVPVEFPEVPHFPFSADGDNTLLAYRIKEDQRRCRATSQQWHSFIRSRGLSSFDPYRHRKEVLLAFNDASAGVASGGGIGDDARSLLGVSITPNLVTTHAPSPDTSTWKATVPLGSPMRLPSSAPSTTSSADSGIQSSLVPILVPDKKERSSSARPKVKMSKQQKSRTRSYRKFSCCQSSYMEGNCPIAGQPDAASIYSSLYIQLC